MRLHYLTVEERFMVVDAFAALYLGGYYNQLSMSESRIHLLDDAIHIVIGTDEEPLRFRVPYRIIAVLYVTAAWTPVVVGPITVLASLLAKKPRILHLGFRDALRILQILYFKMEEEDTDNCYSRILNRIKMVKAQTDT